MLPPLVAFVLVRAVLEAAAYRVGALNLSASAWSRSDAGHYLWIARGSYELVPCAGVTDFAPGDWCGNAGWLPVYPLLIAPFYHLGLSEVLVGAVIAGLFHLGTLLLLWVGFLESRLTVLNTLLLLTAAFFPGAVYYRAIFPLSLLSFLALLAVYLLVRGRWIPAALALGLASATYPTGIVFSGVAAGWLLLARGVPLRARLAQAMATLGAGAVGLGLVFFAQRLETGAWDAYFKVQQKYGHGVNNPLGPLRDAFSELFLSRTASGLDLVPPIQTLLVAGLVLVLVLALLRKRREIAPYEVLLALLLVAVWLFPLVVGGVNLSRGEATLLPAVLLTPRLPFALRAVILLAAIPLAFGLATLFFKGELI